MNLWVLLFLALPSFAVELQVKHHVREFQINSTPLRAEFKSIDMNLSLEEKTCNSKTITDFNLSLKKFSEATYSKILPPGENVSFKIDDTSYMVKVDSVPGKFLIGLPDEFKRMKIEEALRCK